MTRAADNSIVNGTCWLAYFDVLGFGARVREFLRACPHGNLDAFVEEYYVEIIDSIEQERQRQGQLRELSFEYACFSDTFVFYVGADSKESYWMMDMVVRCFFGSMIRKKIPFRGALSIGELYADKNRGILVGDALMEAYSYAEKQNWIGLVLAPTVERYVKGRGLDLGRREDYVRCDVPVKTTKDGAQRGTSSTERLFARRLAKVDRAEAAIEQMRRESESRCTGENKEKVRAKYENTLTFIRSTRLRPAARVKDGHDNEVPA
jgi:hypothetical protein